MARRRSRSRSTADTLVGVQPLFSVRRVSPVLALLEDRRLYHPERDFRPARSFFTGPRLVVRNANIWQKRNRFAVPSAVGFSVPRDVAICIRRKARREVIHAKRLTARGAGGSKRRNWFSDIHC